MPVVSILACSPEGCIADASGKIPWDHPADRMFFRTTTSRLDPRSALNFLIMGRNTYLDLLRMNPTFSRVHRTILVISKTLDETLLTESDRRFDTLPLALYWVRQTYPASHVFISGGAKLYDEAQGYCDVIYRSRIDHPVDAPQYAVLPPNPHWFRQSSLTRYTYGQQTLEVEVWERQTNYAEDHYLECVHRLLKAPSRVTRDGSVTHSLFDLEFKFDLQNGFPLLTTKKIRFDLIITELVWMLSGDTNTKRLADKGNHIWDDHSSREFLDKCGLTHYPEGDIGPSYGFLFRHFGAEYKGCDADYTGQGFDQVERILYLLKNDPTNRRMRISLIDPARESQMALPPCHNYVQFWVDGDGTLCCKQVQRSADWMVGVPFNIAQYALLTHIYAKKAGLKPGKLSMTFVDAHMYTDHRGNALIQAMRRPTQFPQLKVSDEVVTKDWKDLDVSDFTLEEYHPQSYLKFKMIV